MKNYQRGSAMAMVVGIVALIISGLGIWQYMNNSSAAPADAVPGENTEQAGAAAAATAAVAAAPVTLEGNVVIRDMKVGDGAEAQSGMRLSMHYTGTLDDGTIFDSSVARNDPFKFTLGVGEVIPGWDKGIAGMKVGGERKLTVPSTMAYGPDDYGPIPGGSTLHFEVVLLGVEQ